MTWNLITAIFDTQRETHAISRKVDHLMSQQDEINADVDELTAAAQRIQDEIAALQQANPALDLTKLKAAADVIAGIAPPAP